jgi:hypothetical protein
MKAVAIVDTSIFLNFVPVPGDDQDREAVLRQFEILAAEDTALLLPLATLIETGSHIADLEDGGQRYKTSVEFRDLAQDALAGNTPFTPMSMPDKSQLSTWLNEFPEHAKAGHSLADLSIIKEWERQRDRNQGRRVFIWSLDSHLTGYDQKPTL